MSVTAVSAALRDALEKGDVIELEQALVAAEDAMHASPHARKASSSLGNLIARAKDMYLVHMEACRRYVKPLRKACKELNERGIFEALVQARGAPDEVQLCMYTDLCNAETLRHELVEAQKVAVQLLDATSSDDIDNFLSDCSPFLEDRTILVLVQRREDLLREEKRRQAGRMTPLRSASRGMGGSAQRGRRDPLEDMGRYELEDAGTSPVNGPPRSAAPYDAGTTITSSASRRMTEGGRRAGTPLAHAVPRNSGVGSEAYPTIRYAMDTARDSGLQRVMAEGSSPWMQAMRTLRQQAYEEVEREEKATRRRVEDVEVDGRARLYRAEMLGRVQCWADATLLGEKHPNGTFSGDDETTVGGEAKAQNSTRQEKETEMRASAAAPSTAPKPETSRVRLPLSAAAPAASSVPVSSINHQAGNTPTRVYSHSLSAYSLRPPPPPQLFLRTPLNRTPRSGDAEEATPAEGAILGRALRAQLASAPRGSRVPHSSSAAAQSTPRMSRDTPNISPIKETSTTSGGASVWDQDPLFHRGEAKPGWGDGPEGRTTPRRRDSKSSAGTNTPSVTSFPADASPTLALRRIQARLRAVLQEEDIHRRDIEGTEDFDRSVFLFPVSARIAMLRRTTANRLRM
ncbi:hypothetical protein ABB37_09802 [Leptomonas pyrrhocoris]|uniref:Uncharacterized protein n=1 Tax=Leptomonas pyrrhocoris TaxID=157538 RepID=A0A0N0VCT9_LEPPY|nr:hypothetical protein ABB37_09802 [Leptomonas pyrrhocoris]KPA73482.1 hypothetical protein ABB37_09802 [Leptomonas pyrrhocoris]|eukprot:XP_015651921.1 hypothetical protein ABB37_09802 [Leptomonas pyrrhocoris]